MAWKGEESEAMVAMTSGDIKWAQWLRVARGYQLRVGLKDRSKETFDGFTREVNQLGLDIFYGIVLTTESLNLRRTMISLLSC